MAQIVNSFAKFRLKLKKLGITTRQFWYDLKQIPYDYTVGVGNGFKGLGLINRVPDEIWMRRFMIFWRRQGSRPFSRERKARKAKWLSEEALQIAVKRREVKSKRERKNIPIWMQSSKEYQGYLWKDFLSNQCKKNRGKQQNGKD